MYLEVPRRGLGMKDDGTCGQYRHTFRMRHRQECHPHLPKEMFYLSSQPTDRVPNAVKAMIACRDKGAAKRVQGLRAAEAGGYDPVWVAYAVPPPVGKRKKAWHEDLQHRTFCRRCCNIPPQADDLAQRDCVLGSMPSTMHKLLQRLRRRLEDTDVPIVVKEATQNTVAILEQSVKRADETGNHSIEAVAWPGKEWSVKFLCRGCGSIAESEGNFPGGCNRRGRRRPYGHRVAWHRGRAGGRGVKTN